MHIIASSFLLCATMLFVMPALSMYGTSEEKVPLLGSNKHYCDKDVEYNDILDEINSKFDPEELAKRIIHDNKSSCDQAILTRRLTSVQAKYKKTYIQLVRTLYNVEKSKRSTESQLIIKTLEEMVNNNQTAIDAIHEKHTAEKKLIKTNNEIIQKKNSLISCMGGLSFGITITTVLWIIFAIYAHR